MRKPVSYGVRWHDTALFFSGRDPMVHLTSSRQNELKEPDHIAAYFTAKQAKIRTSYLMGRVTEGDKRMEEFHPNALGLLRTAKEAKVDPLKRERINRMADKI